ncbi:MAG: DUF1465 family protein [Hyphomicrobiales bacterium]|nr:DUF1465 family protein [Hyphomicrobiales bacterium]
MSHRPPIGVSEFRPSAIPFRDRYKVSPQFMALFNEGMALVEETADYLDSQGRMEARQMKPPLSIAYATESMRLTTRLTQLASWLLLRRAVARGEMTEEAASRSPHRVVLVPVGRSTQTVGYDELPETLKRLVEASLKLHQRVMRLDRILAASAEDDSANAKSLKAQMSRLRVAYPGEG